MERRTRARRAREVLHGRSPCVSGSNPLWRDLLSDYAQHSRLAQTVKQIGLRRGMSVRMPVSCKGFSNSTACRWVCSALSVATLHGRSESYRLKSPPFACAARICREGCPQLAGLYCRRSSWPVCEVSSSRSMSHVNRFTLNWHLPAVRRQKVHIGSYRIAMTVVPDNGRAYTDSRICWSLSGAADPTDRTATPRQLEGEAERYAISPRCPEIHTGEICVSGGVGEIDLISQVAAIDRYIDMLAQR